MEYETNSGFPEAERTGAPGGRTRGLWRLEQPDGVAEADPLRLHGLGRSAIEALRRRSQHGDGRSAIESDVDARRNRAVLVRLRAAR